MCIRQRAKQKRREENEIGDALHAHPRRIGHDVHALYRGTQTDNQKDGQQRAQNGHHGICVSVMSSNVRPAVSGRNSTQMIASGTSASGTMIAGPCASDGSTPRATKKS